jgi:DNA-binding response OmpR family regulator
VLADLIVQGLREQDMVVDAAGDGVAALNKIENTMYDVIVLDRDLPVRHGDAVCQALSGRCQGAEVGVAGAAKDGAA